MTAELDQVRPEADAHAAAAPSRLRLAARRAAASVAAVVLGLGVSLAIIGLFGAPPGDALGALVAGSVGSPVQIGATANKAIALFFVALGWIVAATSGRVNIGFPGQIIAGGTVATIVGVGITGWPRLVHLPLAVLAGVAAGAAWAGVAAVLWARFRVNELISTLLLNLIAFYVLSWSLTGPLQEPARAFPRSSPIAEPARWPTLWPGTPLSWDVLAVLAALALVLLVPRTRRGLELRLVGANERAAQFAGMNTVRISVLALVLSGAYGGLAGTSLVLAGDLHSLTNTFHGNFGWEGIVVALVAGNAPVACLPVALLLAALMQGGGRMQAVVGVPSALTLVTVGLVVLFVAAATRLVRRG